MVFANSSAYFFNGNVNDSFRIISSLAAPLFIFLAGANLNFSQTSSSKSVVIRGLYLFITASMIDVLAWKIYPFGTFDVLYLISFGIIFCGLLKFGWISDFVIGFVIILFSFFLKGFYRFEIVDVSIFESISINNEFLSNLFSRAFVDGWFPIFPWLGYMFIGRAVVNRFESLKGYSILLLNLVVFISAYFALSNLDLNPVRSSYVEIFYPVTGVYLLLSLSFILFLVISLRNTNITNTLLARRYSSLGRHSLFVYIIHCFFISLCAEVFPARDTIGFFLFCLIQLATLYLFSILLGVSLVSKIMKKLPKPLIKVLGLK